MNPGYSENIEVLRSRLLQKDYYPATTLVTNFLRKWGYVAATELFREAEGNELAPGVWQAAIASLKHTPEEAIVLDALEGPDNCHLMSVEVGCNPGQPGPAFSYTVGLWHNFSHPELICIGLGASAASSLLGFYVKRIASGKAPQTDLPLQDIEGYAIQFKTCRPEAKTQYLYWATWFNSTPDYPVMQLVWQDQNSRWPWDDDFHPPAAQPLLLS